MPMRHCPISMLTSPKVSSAPAIKNTFDKFKEQRFPIKKTTAYGGLLCPEQARNPPKNERTQPCKPL